MIRFMFCVYLSIATSTVGVAKPQMDDEHYIRAKKGYALKRDGQLAAALDEYLWCWDNPPPSRSPFQAVRRSNILIGLQRLAAELPQAELALNERRVRAFSDARSAAISNDRLLDALALANHTEGEPSLLAFFETLPQQSKLLVGDRVWQVLAKHNRWSDILEFCSDPTPFLRARIRFKELGRPVPMPDVSDASVHSESYVRGYLKALEASGLSGRSQELAELHGKLWRNVSSQPR